MKLWLRIPGFSVLDLNQPCCLEQTNVSLGAQAQNMIRMLDKFLQQDCCESNVGTLEKHYSFDLLVLSGAFHTLRKQTTNSTNKCC